LAPFRSDAQTPDSAEQQAKPSNHPSDTSTRAAIGKLADPTQKPQEQDCIQRNARSLPHGIAVGDDPGRFQIGKGSETDRKDLAAIEPTYEVGGRYRLSTPRPEGRDPDSNRRHPDRTRKNRHQVRYQPARRNTAQEQGETQNREAQA